MVLRGYKPYYCVGKMSCVKPMVLMVRNIGVRGGNKLGVKNSVWKL